jgi:uncharacterized membrane protein
MDDLLRLPPLLITAIVTLAVGYLTKQACFSLGLGNSFYCFSDYGGLYLSRELAGGRFPYSPPALEYPAGLGLIVWLTSALTSSALDFVRLTMMMLGACGLIIVWILWRETGRRALLFAAAPTLALYAFLNWDLVALLFGVASVAAFIRKRDLSAGVLLGVGAAIKVFPALLLVPMMAECWREGRRHGAIGLAIASALPVIVINAPVAWVSPEGWSYFLRFNSERPVDWGTLWSVGCQTLGTGLCENVGLVNALSPMLFLAAAIAAWFLVTRTAPAIPRWQLAFPLVVLFFLTNKVYSPQYSLWILPWFALVLPHFPLFIAYEVIDIGIYVTSFAWQQHLTGSGGLPLWPLNLFIALRGILLVVMLVMFARRAGAQPS